MREKKYIKIKEVNNNKLAALFNICKNGLIIILLITIINSFLFPASFACAGDEVSIEKNNIASFQDNISLNNLNPHENNPVSIDADIMDYDNVLDLYHAKGKVSIVYTGATLWADEVELDNKNNVATAQGNAFLKMGEDTLRGEKIVLNIADKTGTAYKANAFYARNNFYVKGDKIEKTGENTYFIKQPVATTCNGDDPDWQIAGSEMKVDSVTTIAFANTDIAASRQAHHESVQRAVFADPVDGTTCRFRRVERLSERFALAERDAAEVQTFGRFRYQLRLARVGDLVDPRCAAIRVGPGEVV